MTEWIRSLRTAALCPSSEKGPAGPGGGSDRLRQPIHNQPRQRPTMNEPDRGLGGLGRAQLCTKWIEEVL